MREWLLAQVPMGIQLLLALQQWHTPWLNMLMGVITDLGSERFYVMLIPIIIWCFDKEIGIGLSYVYLSSMYLNTVLKTWLAIPRPADPSLRAWNQDLVPLRQEPSFSWPSGHAQGSVGAWGYLAYKFNRAWLWGLSVILVLLIGFSRMYVGVHTHTDVIGGLIAGLLYLAIWLLLEPRLIPVLTRLPLGGQIALAVGVPVVLQLALPVEDSATITGAMLGLGLGCLLESRLVRFTVPGVWWKRVLRGIVGLAIVLPVYLGLSELFPAGQLHWLTLLLRFVRYALVGLAATLVAPWVFVLTRLAGQEEKK